MDGALPVSPILFSIFRKMILNKCVKKNSENSKQRERTEGPKLSPSQAAKTILSLQASSVCMDLARKLLLQFLKFLPWMEFLLPTWLIRGQTLTITGPWMWSYDRDAGDCAAVVSAILMKTLANQLLLTTIFFRRPILLFFSKMEVTVSLSPVSPKPITNHLFWIWYWYLETVYRRGLGNDLNQSHRILPFGDERSHPRVIDL